MKLAFFCFTIATAVAQQKTVIVRPVEVEEVLVNPEMGIQTFQRSNGDPINAGARWSEAGPVAMPEPAPGRPDFPESSIAYYRWFWSQLEPAPGPAAHRSAIRSAWRFRHPPHGCLSI